MIAIDTNVLLRWMLEDDPIQSAKAGRLFDRESEILVTDVVLAETIWVLKGRKYRLGPAAIEEVVTALLGNRSLVFEDYDAIWAALNDYVEAASEGRGVPDFADSLVANKAIAIASLQGKPFGGTFTFDQEAAVLQGMNVL